MKRKNKSVTEARANMNKDVLKNQLAQAQMSSTEIGRNTADGGERGQPMRSSQVSDRLLKDSFNDSSKDNRDSTN